MNFESKKHPKLSIIIASYNTGKFLEPTLDSIFAQDFSDFECILMDGASTDDTLEKLKKYPQVQIFSQKDSCSWEAWSRALAVARGEYVMQCCISDGYLDATWFSKCVKALDADPEVSLVWGLPQYMSENGKLLNVAYPQFHKKGAPQKEQFFYYWLASGFWIPEGNFCIRMNVMRECFPSFSPGEYTKIEPYLEIHVKFNTRGYLPLFLPVVASYGRIHAGQLGEQDFFSEASEKKLAHYFRGVRALRRKLLWGGAGHIYRDGEGNSLPYTFSRWHFFTSQIFFLPRAREHLSGFLKQGARGMLCFLGSKKMMPNFLKDAILVRRSAKFGINNLH